MCTHTEEVIEQDNQLTHITKLFIMQSYNESNLTFINHMHVLPEFCTNSLV